MKYLIILFLIASLLTCYVFGRKQGVKKGLNHNPKVEFIQLLKSEKGFVGTKVMGLTCDVLELDEKNRTAKMGNCNFKYMPQPKSWET